MITFIKTINYAEEQSKYINLTDDQGRTYGHLFPDHKTRFIVIDHNGVQTHAQMHHRNQIWGDLRKWYLSTGAVEGDTVIVMAEKGNKGKRFLQAHSKNFQLLSYSKLILQQILQNQVCHYVTH